MSSDNPIILSSDSEQEKLPTPSRLRATRVIKRRPRRDYYTKINTKAQWYTKNAKALGMSDFLSKNLHMYGTGCFGEEGDY